MKTIAVVLEEPEHLVLSQSRPVRPRRRRRRRRHRVERHQHRHRAPALDRPHAALPRHGLSAGAGLRIGRPRRRGRRRARAARSASASSCPAPTASATCAGCSAAPPRALVVPGDARRAGRRARWASTACCWRWPPPPTTRCPAAASATRAARPDRRPRRARPAARAPDRGRRRTAADGLGDATRSARDGAEGYAVLAPGRRPAPRLPRHLRRQRRRARSSTR